MPNGWRFFEDGFFSKPDFFEINRFADKHDEKANLFTVKTGEHRALCYYCGCFDIDDDSIVDVVSNASGKGSFTLGVEFLDADKNLIGERHQGFNLIPVDDDKTFKCYRFRLYFLANENSGARYVRLAFNIDPATALTLRDISLDITPYEIDKNDATYLKFKELEAKAGYRK